ncbi:MAG: amidase [Betaproteobacteria bacterium]|nr:amidase [Betaproteobacteria bacterium]
MSATSSTLDGPNDSLAPGANARVLLEVHDLRSGYGRIPVLHGVSLRVHEGEALGIVGHNGMGKTTLLKTIVGLLPAVGGRILLDGTDVTREPAHLRSRRGLAYVPQGRGILPGLSTLDNLRLAWTGDSHESEQEAVDRCLSLFPRLTPLLDRRGGALSGGEQQILALARALIPNPWIVLLDEPSEGVQPSIVHEIGQLLLRLRKDAGLAIVIVEQNLDLVLDVATHIAVLERGQVAREFSPDEMGAGSALVEALGLGSVRMARGTQTVARAAPSPRIPRTAPPPQSVPAAHQAPQAAQHPAPVSPTKPSNGNTAPTAGASMSRVKRPTHDQMKEIVSSLHMSMSDPEIAEYLEVMEGSMQAYDRLQELPDNLPPVRYPRTPGYRPGAAENPLNAWAVKSEVRGAAYGPLAGKRVVLKDNVCLAGVPMMNGASTLEGYVPDVDATIVTRILDAGGIIVGKSHCEYFCLSGGSHTSALGPVHNPYKHGYAAGGSSSGSGALVGSGEVEMAIGGDQGGSIRMPSCWCGCYGMKPTHGLVPYTGVMPIEATIDHTGPITATVADNALLLEVIAGTDGLDPRQYDVRVDKYTAALGRGVAGMRIAVVSEGFGHAASEPDVDQKVRQGAERLRALGATVDELSIPMHLDGPAIWTAIALEGLQMQMMHGNGMGFNWKGMYTTSLLDAHANWRARANELSRTLKISMLVGEYFVRHYRGHFYAKAQNLSRLLRQAYDDTLNRYDLLLMPTLPMKATPIPDQNAPLALYCQRGFEMLPNTCPFDVTGHPAMSVPCGMSHGLPIGLMLIGKQYGESTIYRAASAFEQLGDWRGF